MSLALISHEAAEKAVIAAIIHKGSNHLTLALGHGIDSKMFTLPACRILFEVFIALRDSETDFDDVAILGELKRGDRLGAIGGVETIYSISSEYRAGQSFENHCQQVREFHSKREIVKKCSQIESEAMDGQDAEILLGDLKSASEVILSALMAKSEVWSSKECAKSFIQEFEERAMSMESPGITTGIHQLDNLTGGMRKGELWIVCGRTSAGKSVLSLQMAQEAIKKDLNILIFTLEMGRSEVYARLLSNLGNVPMDDLTNPNKDGKATRGELQKINRIINRLSEKKLKVADKAGMTIDWISAQAETLAESEPVDLIIVDYIQLIEGIHIKGQSREQEIAKYSRMLKQLAKKLGCPVITPSQLNDEGKLRESRAIGHDADVVLKIEEETVFVPKNRNGQKDVHLPLKLNGTYQRFEFNQYAQND